MVWYGVKKYIGFKYCLLEIMKVQKLVVCSGNNLLPNLTDWWCMAGDGGSCGRGGGRASDTQPGPALQQQGRESASAQQGCKSGQRCHSQEDLQVSEPSTHLLLSSFVLGASLLRHRVLVFVSDSKMRLRPK